MKRKINLKFIIAIMIFIVYAFMVCNKSQALDWPVVATYKIDDEGNLYGDERLLTANDRWGDAGQEDVLETPYGTKQNVHPTYSNFAYYIWNRGTYGVKPENQTAFDWKDIINTDDSDFKNCYSGTSATRAPTEKYVAFMRDKLKWDSENGIDNLYDISNYKKRTLLMADAGTGVGYVHGACFVDTSLENLYFGGSNDTIDSGYNIAYMMAFYKGNGTGKNNVQEAIWNKFNGTTDNSYNGNDLNKANNTYETYISNRATYEEEIELTKDEITVEAASNGTHIKVGTFNMNNYLYYSSSAVSNYSGKDLNYPNLLGGIVGGKVILTDKDGNEQEYAIGTSGSDVYIYSASGLYDTHYPKPQKDFSILIKNSIIEEGWITLKSITFTYRKTDAEGKAATETYYKSKMESDSAGNADTEGNYVSARWSRMIFPFSAQVVVSEKDFTTNINKTLIQANVIVNNYISKIDGKKDVQYKHESEDKYGGVDNRADLLTWTEATKQKQIALAEVGETIQYTVTFQNKANIETTVYAKTTIPKGITDITIKKGNDGKEKGIQIGNDVTTISGQRWVKDNGELGDGKIIIAPNSSVKYIITGKISTGRYISVSSTAEIESTYINGIFVDNKSIKTKSSDYYKCKKYNASLNTYITSTTRADGSTIVSGERLTDIPEQLTTYGDRNGFNESFKSQKPVFVENGDIIVYNVKVKNNATSDGPYYSPEELTVQFKCTNLPTDNSEIVSVTSKTTGYKPTVSTDKKTITVVGLDNGKECIIEIIVKTNNNSTTAYKYETLRKFQTEIKVIKNHADAKNITNNSAASEKISADYFQIKEYNVAVDSYISKVEHAESRGGSAVTYEGELRRSVIELDTGKGNQDNNKTNNAVYVENGDKVTHKIKVYNTTKDEYYNVERTNKPYKSPQNIYVDLQITVPSTSKDHTIAGKTVTVQNGVINTSVEIPANGIGELELSYIVEDKEPGTGLKTTAEISNIENINEYAVVNNSSRVSSTDKYAMSRYYATLDQYISAYDGAMAKYNNSNGFTSNESEGFDNNNKNYDKKNPLELEKYETVIIATKVTNTANKGEDENNTSNYKEYKTRVRPTSVPQTLDAGLVYKEISAIWYKADGNTQDITSSIETTQQENTYIYNIKSDAENIILAPGEYIIYYTTAEVSESNMCLDLLNANSKIQILSNVNRNSANTRIVTGQNQEKNVSDENYMRLKDLVIAGTVWLDLNKNGYNDDEQPKSGITVKLYRADQTNPVATVKTSANGMYTFGRQWKAKSKDANGNYNSSDYIKYYVEFEYDGVIYKATEVYGGDNDGEADGTGNLSSATWRQAKTGNLPGKTEGKIAYLTDSNAYEFDDVRNKLDSEYQTIGFNKSYTGFGNGVASVHTLSYEKNGHRSTLVENTKEIDRIMTARSFIKQDYSNQGGVNKGLNNTKCLFLTDYAGHHNEYPETEYLKFINLGLVEREKVDVSIEADIQSVRTIINGEEMIYEYGKNDADSTRDDYDTQQNAYKLDKAYEFNVYETDYNYRYDDYYNYNEDIKDFKGETSELVAEVTYRIRLNNKLMEDDIETAINEMAIYYDENFVSSTNLSEFINKKITVKRKNSETGLLYDDTIDAFRVCYGTEEQLNSGNGIINLKEFVKFESKYRNEEPSDKKGYKVLYLSGEKMDKNFLGRGENGYIEITFAIDKEDKEGLLRALKISDENMGLELIAEISAYTTKYSDSYNHKGLAGKYAGLVDRDSNPGNLGLNEIEDYANYEDDIYKVGVKIDVEPLPTTPPPPDDPNNPKRTIKGIVWDDARTDSIGNNSTGVQYIGNGTYNVGDVNNSNAKTNPNDKGSKNDKPISGVKVSLVEVVQTQAVDSNGNAKYYEYLAKDEEGKSIETITNENGEYTLEGFVPGFYKVRFDYGYNKEQDDNIIYNGQDYKSTTYFDQGYYKNNYVTDNIGSLKNSDYFDRVKEILSQPNKSDAQDDEIRRLNVNSYSETMTTAQAQVFSKLSEHKESLTKNTHMYAESAIFYVKPENINSAETTIDGNIPTIYKKWKINNLDFGLEYRPETSVVLDKGVENITITTSDGATLVELQFKKVNGERVIDTLKSKGHKNVQYIPNTEKEKQGFVYINMDSELLEGATVKVQYEMDAQNNSEVDRINKNLDNIKYEQGANAYGSIFKVYATQNGAEYTYNANATASQLLGKQYYENYKYEEGIEKYDYLKKIKKPYNTNGTTTISSDLKLNGTGYYGMYLGESYYTGNIGNNDIVAELKVDHILDYIDNDFTFSLSENNTTNRMWRTTTSKELREERVLDFNSVLVDNATNLNLVDRMGVRYDTENRSNLALSVDDNKSGIYLEEQDRTIGNASLSRFLTTNKSTNDEEECTGTISAVATKVLSENDIEEGKGLNYENIAEVVQYTTLTGRRTTLPTDGNGGGIIGNADVSNWNGSNTHEDDTDASEIISITPPTGLSK